MTLNSIDTMPTKTVVRTNNCALFTTAQPLSVNRWSWLISVKSDLSVGSRPSGGTSLDGIAFPNGSAQPRK